MSKQSIVILEAHSPFGYNMWQILQSEHRVFVVGDVPGASTMMHRFKNKVLDFKLAEYQPIDSFILADRPKDIPAMFDLIDKYNSKSKLLVYNDRKDVKFMKETLTESVRLFDLSITWLETESEFDTLESVYHVEEFNMYGDDVEYWKDILESSLPFVKIEESENGLEISRN